MTQQRDRAATAVRRSGSAVHGRAKWSVSHCAPPHPFRVALAVACAARCVACRDVAVVRPATRRTGARMGRSVVVGVQRQRYGPRHGAMCAIRVWHFRTPIPLHRTRVLILLLCMLSLSAGKKNIFVSRESSLPTEWPVSDARNRH